MAEVGIVVGQDKDKLQISMKRQEACAKCRACTMGLKEEEMILQAKNLCEAKVGDRVMIHLEGRNFLKASFIMYGFPLLALVIGAFLGNYVVGFIDISTVSKDVASFFVGIIFMVVSYIIINKNENSFKNSGYTPMAISIVDDEDTYAENN